MIATIISSASSTVVVDWCNAVGPMASSMMFVSAFPARHTRTTRRCTLNRKISATLFQSSTTDGKPQQIHHHHNRKVGIFLPNVQAMVDDDNNIIIDNRWQIDATNRLKDIAHKHDIPMVSSQQQQDDDEQHSSERKTQPYTHYLTAVPYLRINSYALGLSQDESSSNNNKRRKQQQKKKRSRLKVTEPYYIDLFPPSDTSLGYRVSSGGGSGGGEMLLKALGIKKLMSDKRAKTMGNDEEQPLVIYDLTAGIARDSLIILASLNNDDDNAPSLLRLHMVERDPIVALLLSDAIRRLHLLANNNNNNRSGVITEEEHKMARRISQCISMEEGDGITVLNHLMLLSNDDTEKESSNIPYPPDVCYLDPMFPPRKKKSSAVKKDMALLHSLLGTTELTDEEVEVDTRLQEEQSLLMAAYNSAMKRVVVKRPISALPLGLANDNGGENDSISSVPQPSYDIRGSINRFDVYIVTISSDL